ncbi:hypothetical protein GGI19_000593 [Coemansia pectinata]|uniref:Uncharacterized protein n=1 Tax=Coemansia pectinata TaxID=1052879 RepID=A0A9W8H3R4_9FUNG|nr:hypothetical protein GGI19_000593 [Coemansia pectinata]
MTVASTVPNGVHELTVLDGNQSNRANLQFVFFYQTEDKGNIRQQMSVRMRMAFYEAMSHYPILYGELQRQDEAVRIVVSDDSQNKLKPRYDEYNVTERVADIAAAQYNWALWPKELLSVCPVRPPYGSTAELPLVHVVMTWHPDGMGFLVSIDHSVADGVGLGTLLNQWASIMREGQILLPVDADHAAVYQDLVSSVKELQGGWFYDYVDSLPEVVPTAVVGKELDENTAISDMDPRAPQQVEMALRQNTHAMRVTPEAMQRLLDDSPQPASAIRLAYALMWQRYIAAMSTSANSPEQMCLVNVIHSSRHLVDRPCYIGNAVCPVYSQLALDDLLASPISAVANDIGQNMHAVTGSQWLAFAQMINDPVRQAKFYTVFANPSALQLTISNVSRVPYFGVDFGFGAPSHITLYPMVIPGFAVWLPLSSEGGLHILWNLPEHVFNVLKQDSHLTRYVEVLF